MFTVKLGNNQTFEASAVNQSYRADDSERLSIDNSNITQNLEYYKNLLNAENALDTVSIQTEDGQTALTLEGFTNIETINIRVLPTGGLYLNIVLSKPTVEG